nr:F-box domain containing protein [Pandoravirus aubagnensis]
MGRFWIKSRRACAAWPGAGRHMPKRPRRRPPSSRGKCTTVEIHSMPVVALPISIADLPVELVECISAHLRGPDLAALACTCRVLAEVAGTDRLWRATFERDFGITYPPSEHADHAYYGKTIQWLYGLVATPVGRLRTAPNGTLTGRIVAADGVTRRSGEFSLHIGDAGDATVSLDGYGATVQRDAIGDDGAPQTWSVREGVFRDDQIVGRMRHLGDGTKENGSALIDYAYCFRGGSLDGKDHGFGVTHHSDGHVHFGEHSAEHYDGRCLLLSGAYDAYSGQLIKDTFSGYGVALDRDTGVTVEQYRTGDGSAWGIMRATTQSAHAWRVARAPCYMNDDNQSVDGQPSFASVEIVYSAPTTRTSYLSASGGAWERFEHRGHTLVLHDNTPVFLAISDNHPTLAGLRVFGNVDGVNEMALVAVVRDTQGKDNNNASATSRWSDPLRRDCDVWPLGGPATTSLDHVTAIAYLDSISDGDANALPRDVRKDTDGAPRDLALREPFGVPLVDNDGAFSVRCFITGLRTEAFECVFAPNGLLYSIDGFSLWEALCTSIGAPLTDPCTGDILVPDIPQLVWQRWMESVPITLLAPAVREAFRRWASLSSSSLTKRGGSCACPSLHMNDLVRKWIVDALEVPLFDVAHILGNLDKRTLEGSGIGPAVASTLVDSTLLVRPPVIGWDHTKLAHVEFQHPLWDPRGPWRFGSPPTELMPDDPTLADYERDPNAAPAAYLGSHGVIRVALSQPSFVGAHLRDVFFIGQDLLGASFVGATLDRCAFIGCTLDDWRLLDASLIMCGFHDCRINRLPVATMAEAAGDRGAILWPE